MAAELGPRDTRMRLRYAGTCRLCGRALPAGADAVYERDRRTVRCLECAVDEQPAPERLEPGTAGASARREYERRHRRREERIRAAHPKLGGLILALSDDPQSTQAWARGAMGEELLARRLQDLPASARILHDRRIPRTRANIDHIVVSPGGVWVIDAKRYKGRRPSREATGGVFGPRVQTLRIGGRDGTPLVDGARKQAALVTAALDDATPVASALCFLEADWGLFGSPFSISGVLVTWPVRLVKRIAESADVGVDVDAVAARLAAAFPAA